ncbi:MAG TPA: hypothetical protein VMM79_14100 [Longimicrobiales bacterium]|nr:hypothetical protein [Longimicrobiales bacterium]
MSRAIPVALAVILSATACGNGGPSDPDDGDNAAGTFQASISGAVSASFTGPAIFSSIANEGFVLALTSSVSGNPEFVQVVHSDAGRPATGSHVIGEVDGTAMWGTAFAAGSLIQSTGGTLTITSSGDRLRGSLQFQGTLAETGGAVTVTATFNAICSTFGGVCS